MASALADKIKQTQNSFPPQKPGAVAACPYAAPVSAEEAAPVEMKSFYDLTQNVFSAPASPYKKEETKEKKDWIEIILVDMEGKPVPGVRYRITTPGGEVNEGRLNEHGQAGCYQIDPGNCKITFPDLDKDAWE
jgi:hypothetical protein